MSGTIAPKVQAELLQKLFGNGERDRLYNFVTTTQGGVPADLAERVRVARGLQSVAEKKFAEGDMQNMIFFGLATLLYLEFSADELRELPNAIEVNEVIVHILKTLSSAMNKLKSYKRSLVAADLAIERLGSFSAYDAQPLKVDLHFNKALALGELRDYQAALDDAKRVLHLSPKHSQARSILQNCQAALKLEQGPEDQRWSLPIDIEDDTPLEACLESFTKYAVIFLICTVAITAWFTRSDETVKLFQELHEGGAATEL